MRPEEEKQNKTENKQKNPYIHDHIEQEAAQKFKVPFASLWRRLLRVPWTAGGPTSTGPTSVHWKDWCWSWNSSTLATWCEELTHWKRPWSWERLRAGGDQDNRGWDGWMASPTWWTWVLVDSGSWWWTGRPGVLQSMGSQSFGHDWATELNCIPHSPGHFPLTQRKHMEQWVRVTWRNLVKMFPKNWHGWWTVGKYQSRIP